MSRFCVARAATEAARTGTPDQRMRSALAGGVLTAVSIFAAVAVAMPAQSAPPGSAVLYVAPNGGGATGDNPSCAHAQYTDVQSAVSAAQLGGTVVICPGTYTQSVNIDRTLTLRGEPGAVIDASGRPYGIGVGADHVTVSGLTVRNAGAPQTPGDGIVTAVLGGTSDTPTATIGNYATLTGNTVTGNAGAGIDVNSTTGTVVTGNHADANGVGINVVDDFGAPASNNLLAGNTASDNSGGCGFVLADHSGAGIFGNVVTGNTADRNGLGSPTAPNASSGSGLILAGGPAGGVHDNTISGNHFVGNGHGGVTLHAHKRGANFNGNVITGNLIGANNTHNDYQDRHNTGVYLGSAAYVQITITNNLIRDDVVGIFIAGPVATQGVNTFHDVITTTRRIHTYAG